MKVIYWILGICLVIVSACVLYLVKTGIVMRAAPYIKPTNIESDPAIIGEHLYMRLFPDFQSARYVLWGVHPESEEVQITLSKIRELYEKQFRTTINMINAETATEQDVANCQTPCWVFFAPEKAHSLVPNEFVHEKIEKVTPMYFSITWVDFKNPEPVPQNCIDQKFLDLHCLKLVSLEDAQRRFKDHGQRYFFLRKYLDHDYFLFVRTP